MRHPAPAACARLLSAPRLFANLLTLVLLAAPLPGLAGYSETNEIRLEQSDVFFDRSRRVYFIEAELINAAGAAIDGAMRLVVAETTLPVANADGQTDAGEPFVWVSDDPGFSLAPGASYGPVRVDFRRQRVPLSYTLRVEVDSGFANTPPIAEAGADQTPLVGETITLDGSGSNDPDGDELSYRWTLDQWPSASTSVLSDPSAVNPTLYIDAPGRYALSLVVDDGLASSAADTVAIDTQNSPPVADAGADQSAYVGDTVTLSAAGSSDIDGDALTYSWSWRAQPAGSSASLTDPNTPAPSFVVDAAGEYGLELIVNDGQQDSAPDAVRISTLNSPPQADAGADQSARVGQTVTLDGAASSDPDGDPLDYSWSLSTLPPGSLARLDDPTRVDPRFDIDLPGTYIGQLIVNDGEFNSPPDTVRIDTENSRPVAAAGDNQTVTLGDAVVLDGSGSSDADNDPLTFAWSLLSQPTDSLAELSNGDQALANLLPDVAGDYIVQLLVNDGTRDSEPDTTVVTAESDQVAVPEVLGLTQADAETTLLDNGFILGVVSTRNDDLAPAGEVIAQTPAAGTWLASGAAVDLVVSAGPVSWVSPDLTALSQQEAEAAIAAAGLPLGTVTTRYDDYIAAGDVIAQAPLPGEPIPDNGDVDLVVSLGPLPVELPPDPVETAPSVDPLVPTTTYAATEFLYAGENPVQTGVAAGTIEAKRVAVLRGRLLDHQARPLSGVTITVKDHPEFGETLSRADGAFDLALNGGGMVTLDFTRPGYLPAQRQVEAPWQDFVVLPDIVLMPLDPRVTEIDLNAAEPFQVARGNPVVDEDGVRQATLLFPQGTTATMTLPNGSTTPIASLNVRATEYTVGESGPAAMPGPLPPASAYTYAVEFSVDEAIAAGATSVQFSQPVPAYVDNFLGFLPGTVVPVGYWDFDSSAWIPQPNGRVIGILEIENGQALIDSTGDGEADNGLELGVTEEERVELAKLYQPGQTLWRVAVEHFSPWDLNLARRPPNPVLLSEPLRPPQSAQISPTAADDVDNPCVEDGSVISCENMMLGETQEITGSKLRLHYSSGRAAARTRAWNTLEIPLSGDDLHEDLRGIQLEIQVAGREFRESFSPESNLTYTFNWDGRDAYGRLLQGTQPVNIRIGYEYQALYSAPPPMSRSFGWPSSTFLPPYLPVRVPEVRWQEQRTFISAPPIPRDGMASDPTAFFEGPIGGWSLDVHHVYDPRSSTLYKGDGSQRRAYRQPASRIIETIAGIGPDCWRQSGDGGPATEACLQFPSGFAFEADGSIIVAESGASVIRRIAPDGTITTIAGTRNQPGFSGDGGPATEAQLRYPKGVAVMPGGTILIADSGNHRIRAIFSDGTIATLFGTGEQGFSGDGGSASQASFNDPWSIAVDADNSIYIADFGNHRVRRIAPDWTIQTVAGNGVPARLRDDGALATDASLIFPMGVSIGTDGSLLIADQSNRVRRVAPDGIISTVAGNRFRGSSGDGGLATDAQVDQPYHAAITPDGSILITQWREDRIRHVRPDGVISTVAGTGEQGDSGDGGPAAASQLSSPRFIAVAPDGAWIVADNYNGRIRRMAPSLPNYDADQISIASRDGRSLYQFDANGRHLRTLDTRTGNARYEFSYDAQGRLMAVYDVDGNATGIVRDTDGYPIAITAPFGQNTELAVDSNGYLARVANPAGESYTFETTDDGLLTGFTDPNGYQATFDYNAVGRLIRDTNAAGSQQTLVRDESNPDGYEAVLTSELGRKTRYAVRNLPTGTRERKVTRPDGGQATSEIRDSGLTIVTTATGQQTATRSGPDPRFGMQSPLLAEQTTSAGGFTRVTNVTRTAWLDDPNDPLSLLEEVTKQTINGRETTSVYAYGRTVTTTPEGRKTTSDIDAAGRPIRLEVPGLATTQFDYDSFGRLVRVTLDDGADSRVTTYRYDENGNLARIEDAESNAVKYQYDLAGRVVRTTRPDGQRLAFDYDPKGNLISLTPPGRPEHYFGHTEIDQTEFYAAPMVPGVDNTDTYYEYDGDGQLTQIMRPDDRTLDYQYDDGGRLQKLTIERGSYSYTYNAAGQLSRVTAPDASQLDYQYSDSLLTNVSYTGEFAGSVGFGYDNDFRIAEIRVNDAEPIAFGYDGDSLLTQAGALSLNYHPDNGLLTGTQLGNVTDGYSYNAFGEPVRYEANHGGDALYEVGYERDKLGRITRKTETIDAETAVIDYRYDQAGRLIEAQTDGVVTESYGYDANGNRTHAGGVEVGTYDGQDRMLSYDGATYTYTANGELLTKTENGQTTSYSYDERGNLLQVDLPNGDTIQYLIDGQDRRIGKTVNGTLDQGFLYQDQLNPVAEFDGSGDLISRFVYGSRSNVPEYMLKNGEVYRFVTDQLGSPRLVINAATGMVAQRMDYDAFGNVLADSNPGFQPFGFAGGLYDRDTGLVRFGARDYDPGVGRWIAKDPVRFAGGSASLYDYVNGDPVNLIDSTGRNPYLLGGLVIYSLVQAAVAIATDEKSDALECGKGNAGPDLPDPALMAADSAKEGLDRLFGIKAKPKTPFAMSYAELSRAVGDAYAGGQVSSQREKRLRQLHFQSNHPQIWAKARCDTDPYGCEPIP